MTDPAYSVIIPFGGSSPDCLGVQLTAISAQSSPPFEVIVAVNRGSVPDSLLDVLRTKGIGASVLPAAGVSGSAHARNVGASQAGGDLLLFCDSDDEVDSQWGEFMVAELVNSDAVGGALRSTRLNSAESIAWRDPTDFESGLPSICHFLASASTASFGVRADVFRGLGGFDPAFKTSADNDFCWRLQLSGYSLAFAPNALVDYRYRTTKWGTARQAFEWGRSHCQLRRKFLMYDFPSSSALHSLCRLVVAMVGLIMAKGEASRGVWLRRVSYRLGRLSGSLRYRVWYV